MTPEDQVGLNKLKALLGRAKFDGVNFADITELLNAVQFVQSLESKLSQSESVINYEIKVPSPKVKK